MKPGIHHPALLHNNSPSKHRCSKFKALLPPTPQTVPPPPQSPPSTLTPPLPITQTLLCTTPRQKRIPRLPTHPPLIQILTQPNHRLRRAHQIPQSQPTNLLFPTDTAFMRTPDTNITRRVGGAVGRKRFQGLNELDAERGFGEVVGVVAGRGVVAAVGGVDGMVWYWG